RHWAWFILFAAIVRAESNRSVRERRRDQHCTFFESRLAKTVKTDAARSMVRTRSTASLKLLLIPIPRRSSVLSVSSRSIAWLRRIALGLLLAFGCLGPSRAAEPVQPVTPADITAIDEMAAREML